MVTNGEMGECAYTEKWCGCKYMRPFSMFGTFVGICNVVSIWHESIIIDDYHDSSAMNDNISGGTIVARCEYL